MKNFTLLLFSALLVSGVNAQLLDSDFSSWESDLPVGWVGAKTNIGNANILQADNDGGQGDYAVELVNAPGSHKRFTTQQLTVEAGQNYEITFWARGTGDLRTGLFDDRPNDGGGYVYNAYVTVNGNDWQEFTQSIVAEVNTDIAEFILSVRNTAGELNVQIDRVVIEAAELNTVSIYDIQYTEEPNGDSPYNTQTVTTEGIVTAVGAGGYFLQDGGGAWNGLFIYSFDTPQIGDHVVVTGSVTEFNMLTELTNTSGFSILSSGNPVEVTSLSTTEINQEAYEGVLVKVSDATVVDDTVIGFGQYIVNDGSGEAIINPTIYDSNVTLGSDYNITGVVTFQFGNFVMMPRVPADVELATGITEISSAELHVFPNPANDVLNLNWINGISGNIAYNLYNATGQLVTQGSVAKPMGTVDVSNLSPGLYTLNLETEKGVMFTRVMIAR